MSDKELASMLADTAIRLDAIVIDAIRKICEHKRSIESIEKELLKVGVTLEHGSVGTTWSIRKDVR